MPNYQSSHLSHKLYVATPISCISLSILTYKTVVKPQTKYTALAVSKSHSPFPDTASASGGAEKSSWLALRAANKNIALSGDKIADFSELVGFYNLVRTYFSTKSG
jgi:hypothetical protein